MNYLYAADKLVEGEWYSFVIDGRGWSAGKWDGHRFVDHNTVFWYHDEVHHIFELPVYS